MNISNIGEFELITRLTDQLPALATTELGVGDDCAILDLGGDTLTLVTCDSQVEGVHFALHNFTPEQIGRKALAINLSDIAAMGGKPRYALISLLLPKQLPLTVLDGLYAGLRQEAELYGTAIVGGNVSGAGTSEVLVIDITLLGSIERGKALTRSNAQVGDVLCVTGSLGDAAAGFCVLSHPEFHYPLDAAASVIARQTTPMPRVHEGRVLSQFGSDVVTSMLDVSDGLSGDLAHICERSHVGMQLDVASLPITSDMQKIALIASRDPLQWALHGGEDYELLFTVTPGAVEQVVAALQEQTGTPVTVIGRVINKQEGMTLRFPDERVEPLHVKSWNHLS